jgi:integrase
MHPLSTRSRADARDTLRAAYTCAVEEELISRNPAAVVRLPAPRSRKRRSWTVDEAHRFLESARRHNEPLYAVFVLILVLGLRKGDVLGLTWDLADLDTAELYVSEQIQRVGRELLRRQVKTETSEAPLPLPELCVAALKLRAENSSVTARDALRRLSQWLDS